MSEEKSDEQTGPPGDDQDMEVFLRNQARRLAEEAESAVLATIDDEGYPYTSLVEVIFDGEDSFWLLLSDLAVHTKNIAERDRASLMVRLDLGSKEAAVATTRGSFRGRIEKTTGRRDEIGPAYLDVHRHAKKYIDFSDFHFFRFRVEQVRVVAGFGRIGWVDIDDLGA